MKVLLVVVLIVILGSDGRIISQDIEIPRIEVQGQEKSPFEKENSKLN